MINFCDYYLFVFLWLNFSKCNNLRLYSRNFDFNINIDYSKKNITLFSYDFNFKLLQLYSKNITTLIQFLWIYSHNYDFILKTLWFFFSYCSQCNRIYFI